MKKQIRNAKYLASGICLLTAVSFASCSNEESKGFHESLTEENFHLLVEGEETTVEIFVPQIVNGTRATMAVSDEEAGISELWFCAFPTSGSTGSKVVKEIKGTESKVGTGVTNTEADYKTFSVTLSRGEYEIYLIANINDYLETGKKISEGSANAGSTKNDIDAAILKFGSAESVGKLTPGKLPMVCLPSAIKKTANGSAVDGGKYDLQLSNDKIYADMTMLCAKVRYTILWDLNGEGNKFNSEDKVDFQKAQVVNTGVETDLIYSQAKDVYASAIDLTFTKVPYPAVNSKYFSISEVNAANDIPEDLKGQAWTEGAAQRAWQGIAYIPENKNATKTALTFIPTTDANIAQSGLTYTFTTDIERCNFYDFVGTLKTPNDMNGTFSVYVKVNPWDYSPSSTTW